MSNAEQPEPIDLTDEQKREIKDAAADESSALDTSVEELEQRIAPTEAVTFNYASINWKY